MLNTNSNRAAAGLLIAITISLLTSCSTTERRTKPWDIVEQDHPLTGKIWNVREQRFVDKTDLANNALSSRYVLMGETHDNQVHHKHQQWLIDSILKNNKGNGIAFEMISASQAKQIKNDLTEKDKSLNTDKLIDLLEKSNPGWQYKIYYKSIIDRVINAGLPLYPANLDRKNLVKLLREGETKLPGNIREQLDSKPISPELKVILTEEIKQSHCGMANPGMVSAMMLGQRVRDVIMSNSLFENRRADNTGVTAADSKNSNTVMLFVGGSGHTRKDRGIPVFLQQRDSDAKILSMAWLEVNDHGQKATDYAAFWGTETLPFDYVWFTAHVDRPDPCEEMRRYMKKHKEQKGT